MKVLETRGLLENTEVIITSDHGEAFGIHGVMGHSYSVSMEEIGVPLGDPFAGRPGWASGATGCQPCVLAGDGGRPARSIRRVTVSGTLAGGVLEAAAGRSTRRYQGVLPSPSGPAPLLFCRNSPGAANTMVSRCPVAAQGHHYVRTGRGIERLFDLRLDHFEGLNLADSAMADQSKVNYFRKLLLDVLIRSARLVRGRESLPRRLPPNGSKKSLSEEPVCTSPSVHLNRVERTVNPFSCGAPAEPEKIGE